MLERNYRILYVDIGNHSAQVKATNNIRRSGLHDPHQKIVWDVEAPNFDKYDVTADYAEECIAQFLNDTEKRIRDEFFDLHPSEEDIQKTVLELIPYADAMIRPHYSNDQYWR